MLLRRTEKNVHQLPMAHKDRNSQLGTGSRETDILARMEML